MTEKHVVRFEPVGIEIEVDEEQTVLRAAFDQRSEEHTSELQSQ